MKPETEIVELEVISMLAVSAGGIMTVDAENEADEELASQRRTFWDEIGSW